MWFELCSQVFKLNHKMITQHVPAAASPRVPRIPTQPPEIKF